MKKLFTFLIVASLAFTIQAQDVTTTLASGGNFKINNNTGSNLLKVDNTFGNLSLGGESGYANGGRVLNLVKEGSSAGISLNAYQSSGNARSRIDFNKANGTISSPAILADNDYVSLLSFYGHDGGQFRLGFDIIVSVDGTVSSPNVPMQMDFQNYLANSVFLIRADGTINIPDLDINANSYVLVDADGNLYSSESVPSKSPLDNDIQQLKEENIALKAELAELRSMIEMLMKEK